MLVSGRRGERSGEITRTPQRASREKRVQRIAARAGSARLSRSPARAALAGSVEARGRTARPDKDRHRSFAVGRTKFLLLDRAVGGARMVAGQLACGRRDRG